MRKEWGGGQGFQRVLRDAAAEGDTDATLGNQRAPVTEVGVTPFHAPRDFGFSRAFLAVLSFRLSCEHCGGSILTRSKGLCEHTPLLTIPYNLTKHKCSSALSLCYVSNITTRFHPALAMNLIAANKYSCLHTHLLRARKL